MKEFLAYIRNELGSKLCEIEVDGIRIGLIYTGVVLSSGQAGVAYTPLHELRECPVLNCAGSISGKKASKVMDLALSSNLVESAVGVATMNALSQTVFQTHPQKYIFSDVDVLDLIQTKDNVVMVGYFAPLISKILRKTGELSVVEKRKIEDKRVKLFPASSISKALSDPNIVLISGSTLVNKTLNSILSCGTKAREVVLLGPTASAIPQPFFKMGVTAVMGVKITDPERMLKVVGEAGGTRQLLSTCAKKIAFRKREFEQ